MTATHATPGPGHYGAKVQSWRRDNPRELLKKIIDTASDPKDRAAVFESYRSAATNGHIESMIEYWFTNNYNSLMDEKNDTRVLRAKLGVISTSTKVKEFKSLLNNHIKKEAIFLLSTVLPTGKTLADSTFGECAKIGGALSKIATKGKRNELVGKKLTDTQLKRLQSVRAA